MFYLFELSVLVVIRLGSWRHIQEESRRPLSLYFLTNKSVHHWGDDSGKLKMCGAHRHMTRYEAIFCVANQLPVS